MFEKIRDEEKERERGKKLFSKKFILYVHREKIIII